MKVWVLIEHLDGEPSILGVYTTREAAQEALGRLQAEQGCHFTIEASTLDVGTLA